MHEERPNSRREWHEAGTTTIGDIEEKTAETDGKQRQSKRVKAEREQKLASPDVGEAASHAAAWTGYAR